MGYNDNVVDEIKSRCNIVDVIGNVVNLKKAGANYKGLCPFHNEKTPSFVVSETKQYFNCFGCGTKGDVISFVQKYYNLDFVDAVEKLAKEYNIEIEIGKGINNVLREELYEINRTAAKFFFDNMIKEGSPGYLYMYNRGITPSTIKKFGIGYAPDSWTALLDFMKDKGIDPEKLLTLGLVSKSQGRYYDKFRNRVIFPIINTKGNVIGFGGRIIGEGQPKYLNSPESEIFLKKNNLYGLNLSKQSISKEDCAILVEGYMDVVSLYQSGITNVSASLGTALTENQAKMLKRYTKNVILSYDADNAGRQAALRGIDILHAQGIKAKVLHVTDGKDPDEFVKKHGRNAFLEIALKAPGFADYKISNIIDKNNLDTNEGRIEFVKDAVHLLNELSPAEQDIYIKKISKLTGISEGAIRLEQNGNHVKEDVKYVRVSEEKTDAISKSEELLIKLIISEPKYISSSKEIIGIFKSGSGLEIFRSIIEINDDNEELDVEKLKDSLSQESLYVFNNIMDNIPIGQEQTVFDDIKRKYLIDQLNEEYENITKVIEMADSSVSLEKMKELMEEQMKIIKRKQEIQNGGTI